MTIHTLSIRQTEVKDKSFLEDKDVEVKESQRNLKSSK
jgi:hypothetical protein